MPFWALKKLKTNISGLWPDSRPLARLAAVGQIRGLWLDSRPLPDSQHLAVHAGQEVQPSLAYMMHSFECVTNALAQQRDRHHPTPPPPQHITTPGPTYSNVCVFEFGFLLGGGVGGHDRILTGHSPSPSTPPPPPPTEPTRKLPRSSRLCQNAWCTHPTFALPCLPGGNCGIQVLVLVVGSADSQMVCGAVLLGLLG